jgi:hypothetical protein
MVSRSITESQGGLAGPFGFARRALRGRLRSAARGAAFGAVFTAGEVPRWFTERTRQGLSLILLAGLLGPWQAWRVSPWLDCRPP